MRSDLANVTTRTERNTFSSQKPTLEDHVNSIIAAGGPGGALDKRYHYDFLEEVLDKIHRRGELLDLRTYHFRGVLNIWCRPDGTINYELAREAMGELIEKLKADNHWTDEQIIENITYKRFINTRIRYGAKLQGMLDKVYGSSYSEAIMDYYRNHPDERIREKFRGIKKYHFGRTERGTWKLKDGTKNYALARQATGELIRTMQKRYKWTEKQVLKNIGRKNFVRERLRFNATLGGMLKNVYDGLYKVAIRDYLSHRNKKAV